MVPQDWGSCGIFGGLAAFRVTRQKGNATLALRRRCAMRQLTAVLFTILALSTMFLGLAQATSQATIGYSDGLPMETEYGFRMWYFR